MDSQGHICWWRGDAQNQGTISYGIGLALPEYSGDHEGEI